MSRFFGIFVCEIHSYTNITKCYNALVIFKQLVVLAGNSQNTTCVGIENPGGHYSLRHS
jgi:hypothetical protein